MKKSLSLIILITWASLGFAQKYELSLNLKKGETYEQLISSEMKILQEIAGQNIDMDLSADGLMAYTVTKDDGSAYTFDVVYKKMGMRMAMPQMTMDFNSSSGKEDLFTKMLKSMIDKPFQVVMSKNGKVLEVKNLESVIESVISQMGDFPPAQVQQIKSQLSKSYGSEAFTGNIEMATAIFPEDKVKIGETWKVSTALKTSFEAAINTTYTLVEKNKAYYAIKGEATIATEDTEEMTQMNGLAMRFDMNGQMLSDIKVDSETGWIIEAAIQQNIGGDAHIGNPAGSGNDMLSKMQMKGEFKITNGQ